MNRAARGGLLAERYPWRRSLHRAVEDHGLTKQRLLAAEGGIDARRSYPHCFGQVLQRGPLVASLPEQIHRLAQGDVPIEGARPAASCHPHGLLEFFVDRSSLP